MPFFLVAEGPKEKLHPYTFLKTGSISITCVYFPIHIYMSACFFYIAYLQLYTKSVHSSLVAKGFLFQLIFCNCRISVYHLSLSVRQDSFTTKRLTTLLVLYMIALSCGVVRGTLVLLLSYLLYLIRKFLVFYRMCMSFYTWHVKVYRHHWHRYTKYSCFQIVHYIYIYIYIYSHSVPQHWHDGMEIASSFNII